MSKIKKNYIYVDVSITENSPHRTGIQRVVREFCDHFKKNTKDNLVIKYINVNKASISENDDPLMNATNFIDFKVKINNFINSIRRSIFVMLPERIATKISAITTRYFRIKNLYKNLVVKDNNETHTLLLIDSNWTRDALILSKLFQNDGHKIVSVFYDLSPIIEPDYFEKGVAKNFKNYWVAQLEYSDLVLSISKTISNELKSYVKKTNWHTKKNIKYDFIKLGCNFYNNDLVDIKVLRQKNKYLVVGSIEPRKNVVTVLNAFEILWHENYDLTLTVAFNNSWHEESLMARLKKHPLLNKKLFLIFNSSDRELAIEYQASSTLISASVYEGYGLGLAEALNFGCNVIASKIPVYQELYKDNVTFFENNPADLKDTIINQLTSKKVLKEFKPTTWMSASDQLIRKVIGH